MRSGVALGLLALVACGGAAVHRVVAPPPLPAAAYAHYLRGRLAALEGDFERAAAELGEAARAAPDEAGIEIAHIEAVFRAGHRRDARRAIALAVTRWPGSAEAWRMRGRIARSLGQQAEAVAAYRRSLALAPAHEATYLGLASALGALGQQDRAEATYRELLVHVPDSVAGHYHLGALLAARHQSADAIAELRLALEAAPNHIAARVLLSRTLEAVGRHADALATLREAFDRSNDPTIGQQVFVALLDRGDRASATSLVGLFDRDDLPLETRAGFGDLYFQLGEPGKALALADRLLERAPGAGLVQLLRARALVQLDRRADAIDPLLSIGPDDPRYPDCRALVAELLAREGRIGEADAALAQAHAAGADAVELVIAAALVRELAGDVATARTQLEDALAPAPHQADLLYALASLADRQGDVTRTVELVERILADDPDQVSALNLAGYALVEHGGDLAHAARLLRRATRLAPDDGYVLDSFGWLLVRQHKLDRAERALRRAARLAPAEPEIDFHLGELALARAQPKQARDFFEAAKTRRPEPALRQRIDAELAALRDK